MMAELPVLVAAFLVALLTGFAMRRAGLIDQPNHRSSHTAPTPRGGGLGVMAGVFAALVLLPAGLDAMPIAAIVVTGALAAGIGLADDVWVLPESLKFIALLALALAVSALAGPVTDIGIPLPWWLGLSGSALFVFTTVNAVNFMDGSDGLMAGALAIASIGLGLMAEGVLGWTAFAMAAAWLGFAVFNAPLLGARGSVFAGDVGALGGAMLFSGLALYWASGAGPAAAWLAALLLLPFLGDVLLTMAARARARRHLFKPHRAHAYQLLIRMGASHRQVALIWCGLSAAAAGLSVWGFNLEAPGRIGVFWLGVAGFVIFHQWVRRRAKARGLDVTQ